MRLSFDKYPVTLIFCMIWSMIAFFFILIDMDNFIRVFLSIPVIIFIPGYLLVYVLFPERTEKVFDIIDRIALGFGISIAIVPLIGIILSYSRVGLRFEPIVFSLEGFILFVGTLAILRWYHTSPEKRYVPKITLSIPKNETKFDRALTVILVIFLVVAVILLLYVVLIPKQGEYFTEFYILGSEHSASNYPANLTAGENSTIILGITNHERTQIAYSVEVWLSNQTTVFNITINSNETVYHNLWFLDRINISLSPEPINLETTWTPQWEYNYTFQIHEKGNFKLVFLLYTSQVNCYFKNIDYQEIAFKKVDTENTSAYRNVHLWITVQ